jgi:hypothetical protein
MSLLDRLPHKCRIQRRENVTDGMLGRRISRVTVRSNVECWEQPLSVSEIAKFAKDSFQVNTKVYFKTDPGVQDNDEIVITHRLVSGVWVAVAAADEKILQVPKAAYPDAAAGMGALYRVMANYLSGS